MEPIRIAEEIEKKFPCSVLGICEHKGQVSVVVDRSDIVAMCQFLKSGHKMNHLNCLCGVDNLTRKGKYIERFEVIYQLYSIENHISLRLKAQIRDSAHPIIDSITSLWTGADWLERETYDLVGIMFNNHPNLKRILTPEDWQGHPLRKDYVLRGDTEWQGLEELKEKSRKLRRFDFHSAHVKQGAASDDD
ncbi:MAG: NADH-quinone oxidoreductase subunit C [Proteobacteria bacterium]|nr:NADH-quinone oxidoreductase subunit C [Pseudomonadota bacterium]MBU1648745.1 NADH-quinone oxidoreductase subunit C [Pseudomonadota bacterium]